MSVEVKILYEFQKGDGFRLLMHLLSWLFVHFDTYESPGKNTNNR